MPVNPIYIVNTFGYKKNAEDKACCTDKIKWIVPDKPFITQFIQNTATAAMFVPVLIGISEMVGVPAEVLILPVVWAVSMTFMMPPGTAPNAIVHGIGRIKTKEMIRAGIIPTIFALVVLFLYILLVF